MTVGYLTAQDLVDAISEPTYMMLYDDTNSGVRATVDASTGVVSTLRRAHSRAKAILPRIYTLFPPENPAGIPTGSDSIPVLMKDLEVQYATVYAYRRHTELVKTYGATADGTLMKEANELAKAIAEAALIMTTADGAPQADPANVGGVIDSGASGQDDTVANALPERAFADGTSDF